MLNYVDSTFLKNVDLKFAYYIRASKRLRHLP